jgi:hypothetical protein
VNSLMLRRSYSRLEADTLFFIFYFQPSTRQQQLAAKALRASGWLFHMQVMHLRDRRASCVVLTRASPVQHLTWMRRQSNEMIEVAPHPLRVCKRPFLTPQFVLLQVTDDHERGSFIFFDYENGCVPVTWSRGGGHDVFGHSWVMSRA